MSLVIQNVALYDTGTSCKHSTQFYLIKCWREWLKKYSAVVDKHVYLWSLVLAECTVVSEGWCSHCHTPLMIWSCASPLETEHTQEMTIMTDYPGFLMITAQHFLAAIAVINLMQLSFMYHPHQRKADWISFWQITEGLLLNSIRLCKHCVPEILCWRPTSDLRGVTHAYPFINGWLGGGDPDCWRRVSRSVQFHLSKRERQHKVEWVQMFGFERRNSRREF